jgi:AcrR family transcriptional regulator/DNA-binding MarR family transcriptional regulator
VSPVAIPRRGRRGGAASGSAARGGAASLRGGHPGAAAGEIGRSGVPDIQRARMIAALVEVARQRGAARVTVAHIVARSGVSRRTFYEMFADRDACFMAALELAIERGAARVIPAFEEAAGGGGGVGARAGGGAGKGVAAGGAARWRERIRTGLAALLEFLDDEPGPGGLCVVDTLSACPEALRRRAEIVKAFVDAVDAGRREARAGLAPTRLTAEGVVGGVLGVLYSRFAEQDPRPMLRLLNPLMAMIVLPYLGPTAAAKETARPAPRARPRAQRPATNPLEGLAMRLTYRTVRVLAAIASHANASNRQVAEASGVQDQGQISKLLVRLQRLGLIENAGSGPTRGEPNAWQLTPRGREVEHAIREQATPGGG